MIVTKLNTGSKMKICLLKHYSEPELEPGQAGELEPGQEPEQEPGQKKLTKHDLEPKSKRRRIIDGTDEKETKAIDKHIFGYMIIDFKRSHKYSCTNRGKILSRYDDGDKILRDWSASGKGRQVRTCCQALYDNNWEFVFRLEPSKNKMELYGKKDNAKLANVPKATSKLMAPLMKNHGVTVEQFRFDKDINETPSNWDPIKIRLAKAIVKIVALKEFDLPDEVKSLLKSKPEECV
ncbi:hypothetical protein RFI_19083 [Reticulomyxa filosa]|uniref:Uncharacterized protein n=1 Tax=Reticulomyxa filosa TaxID=46433 RepID=X6MWH8_RETFI|nr:hypothetical protein RFI_19083 [Reticulomyxa filosa]|eukprot:ETO18199.1 hypothetical protein RFI_19083 [Reticulomyxa filosa]